MTLGMPSPILGARSRAPRRKPKKAENGNIEKESGNISTGAFDPFAVKVKKELIDEEYEKNKLLQASGEISQHNIAHSLTKRHYDNETLVSPEYKRVLDEMPLAFCTRNQANKLADILTPFEEAKRQSFPETKNLENSDKVKNESEFDCHMLPYFGTANLCSSPAIFHKNVPGSTATSDPSVDKGFKIKPKDSSKPKMIAEQQEGEFQYPEEKNIPVVTYTASDATEVLEITENTSFQEIPVPQSEEKNSPVFDDPSSYQNLGIESENSTSSGEVTDNPLALTEEFAENLGIPISFLADLQDIGTEEDYLKIIQMIEELKLDTEDLGCLGDLDLKTTGQEFDDLKPKSFEDDLTPERPEDDLSSNEVVALGECETYTYTTPVSHVHDEIFTNNKLIENFPSLLYYGLEEFNKENKKKMLHKI